MSPVLVAARQSTTMFSDTTILFAPIEESTGISAGVFFIVLLVLLLLFFAIIWLMQRNSEKGSANEETATNESGAYPGTTVPTDVAESGVLE